MKRVGRVEIKGFEGLSIGGRDNTGTGKGEKQTFTWGNPQRKDESP